jgi:hypothetical protein
MNENASQPIGEAQPVEPHQGLKILKRMGAIVSVTIGGLAAFAFFVTPTRLAGASRSARLLWQNRQKEISEAIQREREATPKAPAAHNEYENNTGE